MLLRPQMTTVLPSGSTPQVEQHTEDARRRRGDKAGSAHGQQPHAGGVEAVDVFGGVEGFDDRERVEVGRQRKLDQDAVEDVVAVQRAHQVEEVAVGRGGGQSEDAALDAHAGARLDLVADVNVGGRVVADEHGGEAGADAFVAECAYVTGGLVKDCGGDRGAVDQGSGHALRRSAARVDGPEENGGRGQGRRTASSLPDDPPRWNSPRGPISVGCLGAKAAAPETTRAPCRHRTPID